MQTLITGLLIGAFIISALSIYLTNWEDHYGDPWWEDDEDEKLEDPEWWFGEKKNDERP